MEKFQSKPIKIEFTVDGQPPKKGEKSLWSEDNTRIELVVTLREKALEACEKAGLAEPLLDPVKLTLYLRSQSNSKKDSPDYIGDLDSPIAGVFDSLQSAPPENNNLEIHP